MSKRSSEEDIEHLANKIRKLERKILKRKRSAKVLENLSEENVTPIATENQVTCTLEPDDWLPEPEVIDDHAGYSSDQNFEEPVHHHQVDEVVHNQEAIEPTQNEADIVTCLDQPGTSSSNPPVIESDSPISLDNDILAILGDDPTNTIKHGPALREELACRLQQIATEGLGSESRKAIMTKYLPPSNCLFIGAPKVNLEIKAAIPETVAKRDKGIETKQKQMASAISCLAEIVSTQLNARDKNNELLQKLMDAIRLLCDLQHGDSVTRRNFILFTLRREMKEHITNTKIDSLLFSEGLPETLKSAKAVAKSTMELKHNPSNRNASKKDPKKFSTQPLNRKAPVRRPPGPPPPPRTHQPAAMRPPLPPPPPPAHSLTRSSRPQQPQYPRRRY